MNSSGDITGEQGYPNLVRLRRLECTDHQRTCKIYSCVTEGWSLLHSALWEWWWLQCLEGESLESSADHTLVVYLPSETPSTRYPILGSCLS